MKGKIGYYNRYHIVFYVYLLYVILHYTHLVNTAMKYTYSNKFTQFNLILYTFMHQYRLSLNLLPSTLKAAGISMAKSNLNTLVPLPVSTNCVCYLHEVY